MDRFLKSLPYANFENIAIHLLENTIFDILEIYSLKYKLFQIYNIFIVQLNANYAFNVFHDITKVFERFSLIKLDKLKITHYVKYSFLIISLLNETYDILKVNILNYQNFDYVIKI